MKVYSEILEKFFDSVPECIDAESKYQEELEEKERVQKEEQANISKEKKALAKAIDEADEKLAEAYEKYKTAREDAQKIIKEASDNVKTAQEQKYKAIHNFNSKFGVYTKSYAGDKALTEYQRTVAWFDNFFGKYF